MLWWIVRGGGGPNEGHGGRSSCAFGVSATDIDLSHVKIVILWHRAGCNWDALIPKRFFESTAVLQSCRFLIDGTIAILSFWVTHLAVPVAIFLLLAPSGGVCMLLPAGGFGIASVWRLAL